MIGDAGVKPVSSHVDDPVWLRKNGNKKEVALLE